MVSFDVLIPSFYRTELLLKCLMSILDEDVSELKQIIVLAHSKDLETTSKLEELKFQSSKLSYQVVADIPPPGESRNKLIEKANSDFLYFIDDDAHIPKNYFELALSIMKDDTIDVLGGPDQYHDNSGMKQMVLGELMKSTFVMGPTFKRHSRTHNTLAASEVELTLCNLWVRNSLFKEDKFSFDPTLMRCEENVLLEQFKSTGKKLTYFSDLFVYHFRREGLLNIFKMQLKSGFYRGLCFLKEPKTFKWFFLIPILTGLVIILTPTLPLPLVSGLVLAHLTLSFLISLKVFWKMKLIYSFFYSIFLITLIHIGFSLGISVGTIKGLISARK